MKHHLLRHIVFDLVRLTMNNNKGILRIFNFIRSLFGVGMELSVQHDFLLTLNSSLILVTTSLVSCLEPTVNAVGYSLRLEMISLINIKSVQRKSSQRQVRFDLT